jgi:hypothetical protein
LGSKLAGEPASAGFRDAAGDSSPAGVRMVFVFLQIALSDMAKADEPIPEAIASKHFSGKFMVRVPPEVHRRLAIQAAESGVSLNRIASSKLSQ